MKKVLIIGGVVLVLVAAAVGVYFVFFCDCGEKDGNTANNGSSVQAESYTFSALATAIEMGIPLKCSYSVNDTEAQGYIKGEQWRGKVRMEGEEGVGEVLMKENCMWTWSEEEMQGAKICFDTGEDDSLWDQSEGMDTGVTYVCEPVVVDDSLFDVPADVEFMDFDELAVPAQ